MTSTPIAKAGLWGFGALKPLTEAERDALENPAPGYFQALAMEWRTRHFHKKYWSARTRALRACGEAKLAEAELVSRGPNPQEAEPLRLRAAELFAEAKSFEHSVSGASF